MLIALWFGLKLLYQGAGKNAVENPWMGKWNMIDKVRLKILVNYFEIRIEAHFTYFLHILKHPAYVEFLASKGILRINCSLNCNSRKWSMVVE